MTSELPLSTMDPWQVTSFTDVYESTETAPEDGPNCEMYDFLVTVIITGGLCVFGWIGNTLSFLVMWPERKHSATSLTLLVLAVIDNLVLVFRFIMKVIPAFCRFQNMCPSVQQYVSVHVGVVGWGLNSMAQQATTWNAVIMTVIRYIYVCVPHRSKTLANVRTTQYACAANIFAAIIFNLPRMFERTVIYDEDGEAKSVFTQMAKKTSFSVGYKQVAFYLVFYVIPLTILIILTSRLIIALRKVAKKREEMTKKVQERQDITMTLVAVVIVFIVCQLFTPARRTIIYFVPQSQQKCPYPYHYFNELNSTAIVFNSAINFVLYCVFGKRFRKNLLNLLSCYRRVGISDTSINNSHQPAGETSTKRQELNVQQSSANALSSINGQKSSINGQNSSAT
uniref:Orphan G-protein coupled receptor 7 n=1 Tax=Platynereis dumerilii TaxID=6359 RepID=A0A0K0PUG1_PLADU|nr:orphan G-protein coupled receptor 7 [Platynereis dumerilii]